MASRNKLLVPGAEQALDQFKYEVAQEFGVNLSSDTAKTRKRLCRRGNDKTACTAGSITIKRQNSIM